jgi:L-lactate utilization protein LutC
LFNSTGCGCGLARLGIVVLFDSKRGEFKETSVSASR